MHQIAVPLHTEKHFQQSEIIKDIVIGMADGLTVPFALAAGLTSIQSATNGIIVTAGLAEIIAGSIAMGLGGYLAGKTEYDHYQSELDREHREIKEFRDVERQEVKDVFAGYGLSPQAQEMIITELEKDEDKWVDFMMKYELGLDKPDIHRARQSARNIGLAYIAGGIVPLSAYIFTVHPDTGLLYSSVITIFCLFGFGYFKSKFTGQPALKGAFRTTLIGILAAAAAFFIARAFNAA